MESVACIFLLQAMVVTATAKFCNAKAPFELGEWHGHLKHLDTATIENNPVSVSDGQYYVYENTFPKHTIKYINVDNVAQKTCGASTMLKRGGIGTSSVLLVLHAEPSHEIRSVIEVWGSPITPCKKNRAPLKRVGELKNLRSRYLFTGTRALSHNAWDDTPSNSE